MGRVHAEIELINSGDLEMARRNLMDKDEVKRIYSTMLVDTGADLMAINEVIQSMLDLPFIEKRSIQFANGHRGDYDVVGPVDVRFNGRRATCTAIVLSGESEPLLGVLPMEEMALYIHPLRQELFATEELIYKIPSIRWA